MNVGLLTERVTLDEPSITRNEYGEEVHTWSTRMQVWAHVAPITGREALAANQPIATIDTRITTHYTDALEAVDARWRARHRGIVYQLVAPPVNRDMRNESIELLCRTGTGDDG